VFRQFINISKRQQYLLGMIANCTLLVGSIKFNDTFDTIWIISYL